jgi:rhodanese-related sulfurtransferase
MLLDSIGRSQHAHILTLARCGLFALLVGAPCLPGLKAGVAPVMIHRDVGSIPSGADTPFTFLVTNPGPAVLEISRITPSCDCLALDFGPRRIAPGAAGLFAARLHPDNAGPFAMSFDLDVPAGGSVPIVILSGVATAGADAVLDASLLVKPERLMREAAESGLPAGAGLPGSGPVVWVDVRNQEEYRWARIPGSLNFPLHTLSTRGHLRDRRVVLVNAGESARDLLDAATRLRTNGFASVAVLDGGLRAWWQSGGAVVGDQVESPRWAEVAPYRFQGARAEAGWLLVAVAGRGRSEREVWTPGIPELDIEVEDVRGRLEDLIKAHPGTRRVMVLSSSADRHGALEMALRGFSAVPVFYLSGGSQGYTEYLRLDIGLRTRRSVTVSSRQSSGAGARRSGEISGINRSGGCCGSRR